MPYFEHDPLGLARSAFGGAAGMGAPTPLPPEQVISTFVERLNTTERLLVAILRNLERSVVPSLLAEVLALERDDVGRWWEQYQAEERERAAQKATAKLAERDRLRESGRAKLTVEELEALGLSRPE